MDFVGRFIVFHMYVVTFIMSLLSHDEISMGVSVVFASLTWLLSRPVHKQKKVA